MASSRKRIRAESSYARQRNITACTVCRNRKTKCDNKRPTCSFCEGANIACVYEDSRSDFSNYDAASLCIIDRIDRMGEHFNARLDALVPDRTSTFGEHVSSPPVLETMLSWSAFEAVGHRSQDQSLALRHAHQGRSDGIHTASLYPGIEATERMTHESLIPSAIRDFLQHVHSKNPILDQQYLEDSVQLYVSRDAMLDEQRALVFISLALGLIGKPFVATSDPQRDRSRSIVHGERGVLAEQLSTCARAILGIATPSLIVIQCLFFCGVYDMYRIRPVDAYLYFNRASMCLKLHLLGKRPFDTYDAESREGRLLRRLYWSCMQSECELAAELSIVDSGLGGLNFPYAFPSPPVCMEPIDGSSDRMRSWLYYLSETSLRRISKEIVTTLYHPSITSCTQDLDVAYVRAERLNKKLEAWMAHLPHALVIERSSLETTNELGLHIRSRYLMCRSWIHQPFLHFLVHAAAHQLEDHEAKVETMASICLQCAIEVTDDVTAHHRHHGTWFVVRMLASNALVLLAAAISQAIAMPDGWEIAVQRVIEHVGYWEGDSDDLGITKNLLIDIFSAIKTRQA